jgi:hypothetical protein
VGQPSGELAERGKALRLTHLLLEPALLGQVFEHHHLPDRASIHAV